MEQRYKKRQMSESLYLGALLAITGGFLEAYTYISRGRVFANAQTGNIALFGIKLAERNFRDAFPYLLPILAFILGVFIAARVRDVWRTKRFHWRQFVLVLEMLCLTGVALMERDEQNDFANILVSFVCAMQIQAFQKMDGHSILSTVCTGNLRNASVFLARFREMGTKNALKQSFMYFFSIQCFLLGVLIGAGLTNLFSKRAVLFACAILLAAFCLLFIEEAQN
jgi:uncharacterized membrane protein YoaK (UPF0700 family)